MKTVVVEAHPNIALIKYWGKRDLSLNLPAVPSLSVTLDQFRTRTALTWDVEADEVVLDGAIVRGSSRARVLAQLDRVAHDRPPCHVVSDNNFPTAAGLASSSSSSLYVVRVGGG